MHGLHEIPRPCIQYEVWEMSGSLHELVRTLTLRLGATSRNNA